jgi:hypothetical protein
MTPKETIIVVAEDGPLVRNLVQLILAKEGYILLSAIDGQEALELYVNFSTASRRRNSMPAPYDTQESGKRQEQC